MCRPRAKKEEANAEPHFPWVRAPENSQGGSEKCAGNSSSRFGGDTKSFQRRDNDIDFLIGAGSAPGPMAIDSRPAAGVRHQHCATARERPFDGRQFIPGLYKIPRPVGGHDSGRPTVALTSGSAELPAVGQHKTGI